MGFLTERVMGDVDVRLALERALGRGGKEHSRQRGQQDGKLGGYGAPCVSIWWHLDPRGCRVSEQSQESRYQRPWPTGQGRIQFAP